MHAQVRKGDRDWSQLTSWEISIPSDSLAKVLRRLRGRRELESPSRSWSLHLAWSPRREADVRTRRRRTGVVQAVPCGGAAGGQHWVGHLELICLASF